MINETFSVQQFIDEALPQIVGEGGELYALFSTYREVHGRPDGAVDTGKPGLKIMVQNGESNGDPDGFATLLFCLAEAGRGNWLPIEFNVQAHRQRASEAQAALANAAPAATAIAKGQRVLAVIYVGLTSFDDAVEFARQLRHELGATVVAVTCDCELERKERQLAPLLESGEISHVVVTPQCGGCGPMADILDALIEKWPSWLRQQVNNCPAGNLPTGQFYFT